MTYLTGDESLRMMIDIKKKIRTIMLTTIRFYMRYLLNPPISKGSSFLK